MCSMIRKSVALVDAAWVPAYVEVASTRHALLAARLHTTAEALDSESKVLAGLIELGRRVVEEDAETALYNEEYGGGLDEETAAAFAMYDAEAQAATIDAVQREERPR